MEIHKFDTSNVKDEGLKLENNRLWCVSKQEIKRNVNKWSHDHGHVTLSPYNHHQMQTKWYNYMFIPMATYACIAFCSYFFVIFLLGSTYWMSLLRAVTVLTFLVTPSTYSVIYSEKYVIYLGKFWSHDWGVPGPLFLPSSYSEKMRWRRGWFLLFG